MARVRNILFIMTDQLRWDYLSCYGHPALETPHLDGLAAKGTRFTRAYCQSPICGASRMSFYTGRYMFSHGATWNNVPLAVGELTLGDWLRPLGLRTALVGKTHMAADREGMQRLGIDPASNTGILLSECGFQPYERDDGLHPDISADPDLAYNRWLRERGYDSPNPWHDFANSAEGPDGEQLSGWYLRYAPLPARVKAEHSETAYMTGRAMEFIREQGEEPWCLHLSYIKPHWPYIAPAPYHDLYGANSVIAANRHEDERRDPHPVHAAFMAHEDSRSFARDEVRRAVIPAYMGLVREIDDHMGRLFAFLEEQGRMDDTMIVFTSDHGDYLGDHWLGEKELFHEESVRIPLILYDPSGIPGAVVDDLVESIDLVPTFVEAAGGEVQPHRMEGRSLLPLLRDGKAERRDAVFAETDYAHRAARLTLGRGVNESRGYMVRTERWKYLFWEGYRPQLFDLAEDPLERADLGSEPDHAATRAELHERLFAWLRARRTRTTLSDAEVAQRTDGSRKRGFIIGVW